MSTTNTDNGSNAADMEIKHCDDVIQECIDRISSLLQEICSGNTEADITRFGIGYDNGVIIELLMQYLSGLSNWKSNYDLIQAGANTKEVSKDSFSSFFKLLRQCKLKDIGVLPMQF